MTFQLDTSGDIDGKRWDDLTPFAQGYIKAMLTSLLVERQADSKGQTLSEKWAAFSDLAPETLARTIADCEALESRFETRPNDSATGRRFYIHRQEGDFAAFPPLTVQLSDDGKVRFQ